MKTPLSFNSSEKTYEGFETAVRLVDLVFGKDARDLSLKGHELTVYFGMHYNRITSIGASTEDKSTYTFKWERNHQTLCRDLTEALQPQLMKESFHNLGFKMEEYGLWSIGRSRNKAQEDRDNFDISAIDLAARRENWFKDFIKQDDVMALNLTYPAMPRPFGPIWPSNRFGYMLGRAEKHLWLMSHGLSNPRFPSADHNWETSDGIRCEVMVRCDPTSIDLTGTMMEILSSPEMILLDTLCATIVNMDERNELDFVPAAQRVKLEYYKHTPTRPLPPETEFVLTNAASFGICDKIPALGPYRARPLIASLCAEGTASLSPDDLSRELIKTKQIGILPPLSGKVDIGL